jgi:5-methylthioadenosine/S-adenosylhomocysteine deaminase
MKIPDALNASTMLLQPQYTLVDDIPQPAMAVLIRDGYFADVGPQEDVLARHPELTPVALPGRLLMPGFIDTHNHLTQSYGKALAFGEPSEIFKRIWVPLEQHLTQEDLHLSAQLAALEALRGGFTTVCDAGTRSQAGVEAIEAAVAQVGIRCVLARICHDLGQPSPQERQVEQQAAQHLSRYPAGGTVHPSLAIAIPEAASDRMLHHIAHVCREAGVAFQVHVNEHLASVERSLVARGRRPLEVLHHADALGPELLAAHVTLVTPSELSMLRAQGAAVSYNPVASSWKGNAVAPALHMHMMGIRLGLGTDGTRADGFRLMDAAETAQRLTVGMAVGDFSAGAGWTWLAMASAWGADAAHLSHLTGRIATGLAADCLLVDIDVPELTPSWDLGWELVRLAQARQIEAVMVQGRLRLWQGWPTDWDARALMHRLRERAQAAVAAAPIQRIHPTSAAARHAADGAAP